MTKILAVAIGGSAGALLRYGISEIITSRIESKIPVATLVANIVGCLIIGLLWKLFFERAVPAELKLFLLTGFIGSLTTFSTYTLEYILMFKGVDKYLAFGYFIASNILGAGSVIAGIKIGDLIRS